MIELSVKTEAHVKVVLQIKDTDVLVLRTSSQLTAKKVLATLLQLEALLFFYKGTSKNDFMLLICS